MTWKQNREKISHKHWHHQSRMTPSDDLILKGEGSPTSFPSCNCRFQLLETNDITACNTIKIELEMVPDLAQRPGPEEKLSYPILPGPKSWQNPRAFWQARQGSTRIHQVWVNPKEFLEPERLKSIFLTTQYKLEPKLRYPKHFKARIIQAYNN